MNALISRGNETKARVPKPDASPVTGYHKGYALPSIIQHYVTKRRRNGAHPIHFFNENASAYFSAMALDYSK